MNRSKSTHDVREEYRRGNRVRSYSDVLKRKSFKVLEAIPTKNSLSLCRSIIREISSELLQDLERTVIEKDALYVDFPEDPVRSNWVDSMIADSKNETYSARDQEYENRILIHIESDELEEQSNDSELIVSFPPSRTR